jgi:hypothetical protein
MEQKNNSVSSAETKDELSANAEVTTSSPNNAKPYVGGRFSVSVVYQKIIANGTLESALRSSIIEANSEEEALGKLIYALNKEMNNWNLALKCVLSV